MNLVGCIPRFFSKHGGWVFTALSSVGVVGTAILVAEEAPAAKEALQAAEDEKGAPLTFGEKFEVAAPIYLPAFLVGGGTIGCMVGAQIFNDRQKAALVAAYALLGTEFNEYRNTVREAIGEEKEHEIWLESRQKIKELREENERLKKEAGNQLYAIATLPGVVWESNPAHMNNVFHHMLYNMLNLGAISLKDLYGHIGLPDSVYNKKDAEEYGWETYENQITYGGCAVEFEITDVERQDGVVIHIISTTVPPYELGLDYGMTDSSTDYLYPGYDFERTLSLSQASVDGDIERFEQPELWIQHMF